MMQWITMAVFLADSVLFTAYQLDFRKHLRLKAFVAAAGMFILCALLSFWNGNSFVFLLLLGQAGCLLCDAFAYGRKIFPVQISLYLCMDTILLPLLLCKEEVWRYAVYLSIFILCIVIALLNETHHKFTPMTFYAVKKNHFLFLSLLPCSIWMIDIPILAVVKTVTSVGALVLSCVFLCLFALILWLQAELIRRLRAEEMNEAVSRWQRESRDYMNTIRSQRHDFNLHLHAISGLINSEEYEGCRKYIQNLVLDANDVNDIMPVGDAVVGAMLYNMREEARRRGSDIVYDITYDMSDILCNGFECNKIIGNLLQNAIDALQSPEDKAYGIKLSIFKRRGNTVIITENRFVGDPDRIARVFEPGYSTKRGHEGIGLSMVLRTVRSYGGRVYPEFDHEKIRFVVNIPNKVNLCKGGEVE